MCRSAFISYLFRYQYVCISGNYYSSAFFRSFYAVFKEESTVNGIPCYTFEVPAEAYDTTRDENAGFRYRNMEKVNYFTEWDPCPK